MRHDSVTGEVIYELSAAVTAPDVPAEVFADIRFRKHDVSSLSIRLNVLGDDRDHRILVYSQLSHPEWDYLSLYAKAPETQNVELMGIRGIASEGGSGEIRVVIPEAEAVQIGITDEVLDTDRTYGMGVQLTPSGIVQQPAVISFKGNGEIEREHVEEGEITLETAHGTWSVRDFYDSGSEEEFGNKVTKLVQRAVIFGNVLAHAGETLATLNATVQQTVFDICTILSLCYRVRVTFYEISYVYAPEDAPAVQSIVRRKILGAPKRSGPDDLINFRDLIDGGLHKLFSAYSKTECKEELSRGIGFLASAYSSDSLEGSYFLAFSALECVVSAGEGKNSHALGEARWGRLKKQLTQAIADYLETEVVDATEREETRKLLAEKLPEVRRISIRRRVLALCEKFAVKTADLWPASVGFDSGFTRATAARNALFHAATCDAPDEINSDLVRLRVLTERIVLRLLAWPDDKIWRWYDQGLRWTNSED